MITRRIRSIRRAMGAAPKGFTILFASLVASLLLAVGLVIFDITYKEVLFSTVARDSDFAIYAADSGLECALYWDARYAGSANYGSGSVFATSTNSSPPQSGVVCNSQDIAAAGVAAHTWPQTATPTSAITAFSISFSPQPYCVSVVVSKTSSGGVISTSITATGFNTCVAGAPNRIERTLQANY